MKASRCLIILFIVSWGVASIARPASGADIYQGRVVDEETGQPLAGAAVTVVWAHDEIRHEGRVRLDEAPSPIPSWMNVNLAATAATGAGPGAPSGELDARLRRTSRAPREHQEIADTTAR